MLSFNTDVVIGTIDVYDNGYDIGYCFISRFHEKGYAKESCSWLIVYYSGNGGECFTAGTAFEHWYAVRIQCDAAEDITAVPVHGNEAAPDSLLNAAERIIALNAKYCGGNGHIIIPTMGCCMNNSPF